MGKMKKKFAAGTATQYISRSQAVKRLQISLKDFRRLCILKGVYPNEPRNKKKANRGSTGVKTFYFLKDIQYLAHDPIITKFRDFKVFVKKMKKAQVYKDPEAAARLRRNKPVYKLDHIVKERYPSFVDALRDLDDCLSTCFLFATFPKSPSTPERIVRLCRRLTVEFMHYVMAARALRKVFVSIKGVYYQAELAGQTVTWITPHALPAASQQPADVDFKIMLTFAEFYTTLLGFVNFHLYSHLNLNYPPKIAAEDEIDRVDDRDLVNIDENFRERISALNQSLMSATPGIEEDAAMDEFPATTESDMAAVEQARQELEKMKRLQQLFADKKIFLNREVPREALVFVIRSCGGECSWDRTTAFGATFAEDDPNIAYQIVDRPVDRAQQIVNRYYVQPQWVFDSVNARQLLPVEAYFVGQKLPPHLSPFVDNSRYQPLKEPIILPAPTQRLPDIGLDEGEEQPSASEDEESDTEDKRKKQSKKTVDAKKPEMAVKRGVARPVDLARSAQVEAGEERKLAVMAMPKKRRHLYERIKHGQAREAKEVRRLQTKRQAIQDAASTGKK